MPWPKKLVGKRVEYTAPARVYPLMKVVYDPLAAVKWSVQYAWLAREGDTVADVEALMDAGAPL